MRQLVLRSVDRASDLVILHTDVKSAKCAEIAADPRVAILAWNPDHLLQIRLSGRAELLGAYAAQKAWSDLPFASQGNYGVSPAPGTPIAKPHAYQREADPKRLAVVSVKIDAIDAVHLAEPRHIRAKFRQDDGWAGRWVAP